MPTIRVCRDRTGEWQRAGASRVDVDVNGVRHELPSGEGAVEVPPGPVRIVLAAPSALAGARSDVWAGETDDEVEVRWRHGLLGDERPAAIQVTAPAALQPEPRTQPSAWHWSARHTSWSARAGDAGWRRRPPSTGTPRPEPPTT
ncbi:MAG TPA: hypothetical protein P5181_02960 [Dermatophilaceae bacterium]|nr:hypothetical protein [Dermatophilaceae bacterium]